ncbi:MAG: YhjD/YihY/BrkB family envelope integrity protein, partial [Mycobacteriales bacterium]
TATAIGDVVQSNAGKAGLIGLGGTLLSGLGWINALRTSIRVIWHQSTDVGNIVITKIRDVVALVGLFAVVAASVVVSGAATAATQSVVSFLGLADTTGAKVLTIGLSYALGFLVDMGIFLYLFLRFSQVRRPVRQVVRGAVFGAFGFEVLKSVGALYIGRTTSKGEATYGTFAVVVGLLLFLNLVSRLILITASFVVTAPYDSDVAPSGTAMDQDEQTEGGPAMPEQPARSWSRSEQEPVPSPPIEEPIEQTELPGAKQVVLAARVLKVAGGVAIVGVIAHLVRTLLRLRR